MVGIVIVSHSALLADGILELVRGMSGEDVRLAAAGGVSEPDVALGTDPNRVVKAIQSVYSDDGVVVFMDLGSALLSTEMALEMLPPEMREHVVLCDAPVVEGAVSAAVQARLGSNIEQVVGEARSSLEPKSRHLGTELSSSMTQSTSAVTSVADANVQEDSDVLVEHLTVTNRLGLHARPVARFVRTAGRFPEAVITVRNSATGKGPVNATSINSMATLGVSQGDTIEICASGIGAAEALDAIKQLARDNFGDAPEDAPKDTSAPIQPSRKATGKQSDGSYRGIPTSSGIALGPARLLRLQIPDIPVDRITSPQKEWDRLLDAIDATAKRISATMATVIRQGNRSGAEIFDAHLLILEDQALREPVRGMIFDQHLNAAAAWHRATRRMVRDYQSLADEYLRARAADIADVGMQVVLNLLDPDAAKPILESEGVLIAEELSPADAAGLDSSLVRALCIARGGPSSHSAILAGALGIPAIVSMGEEILEISEGTPVLVDAQEGVVVPHPGPDIVRDYQGRMDKLADQQRSALLESAGAAVTVDGRAVEIGANIGSEADARAAVRFGAEGAGLVRTEFLFLDRQKEPNEQEQYQAYRDIAKAMEGRPVIFRTLDVGGDKPLPYLNLEHEDNPFLGWRAIRVCLDNPDFFKTQLRAIVRVAADYPVRMMFPMVATLHEVRTARTLVEQAKDEAFREGHSVPDRIETGIMVEIPSVAVSAEQFAAEVDFFSIGTNDLIQYSMAAERGNARVSALADGFQPAVLSLIRMVVDAAHRHGKWVGMCGELAGDVSAVPLLVGLGLDELSMSAPSIPTVKTLIRKLSHADVRDLALSVAHMEDANKVRGLVSAWREENIESGA